MTAETLTGLQAQSDARVPGPGAGGAFGMCAIYGEYSVAAAVEVGDIFELGFIPDGFLVLGGNYYVGDMDQHATETLDMDLGWAASGPAAAATFKDANDKTHTDVGYSADPDGFVNSGVLEGDAVTGIIAAAANIRPFPMATGPLYFDKKTKVQAEVIAVAATFNAAKVWFVAYGIFIKQ